MPVSYTGYFNVNNLQKSTGGLGTDYLGAVHASFETVNFQPDFARVRATFPASRRQTDEEAGLT